VSEGGAKSSGVIESAQTLVRVGKFENQDVRAVVFHVGPPSSISISWELVRVAKS
jgi:hypothetical protein